MTETQQSVQELDPGSFVAPGASAATGDAPTGAGSPPPNAPGAGENRSRRRRRWWAGGFAVLTLLFALFAAALGWGIYDNALDLRGGDSVETISDATAPGYEASVLPTPVHLVAIVDDGDQLVDVMLLVEGSNDLSGVKGPGSVVWILGETEVTPSVDVPPVDGAIAATESTDPLDPAVDQPAEAQQLPSGRLTDIYALAGMEGLLPAVGDLVGFGVNDSTVWNSEQLAAVTSPVSPLTVNNPDPLSDPADPGAAEFAAGEIAVEATGLLDYLSYTSPGEVPTNRATRARAAMEALVGSYSTVDVALAAPVATSAGDNMVDILSSMSEQPIEFVVLPVEGNADRLVYTSDSEAVADAVRDVVQFPVSAFPGQRPRVRLLNGTGNLSAATAAAPVAVSAGGEVVQIGNAGVFDDEPTVVEFHVLSAADAAVQIAAELGVEAVPTTNNSDVFDITVTLGSDYTP